MAEGNKVGLETVNTNNIQVEELNQFNRVHNLTKNGNENKDLIMEPRKELNKEQLQ